MSQTDTDESSRNVRQANSRPVLKSIGATMTGYVAGMLCSLIGILAYGGSTAYLGLGMWIVGWYLAMFTFPCWAAVVLPTWLFLPNDSALWRPGWAALSGAGIAAVLMIGTVVALNLLQLRSGYYGLPVLAAVAAIVGAVTGLVGGLLNRR